jgi:phage terminase large subunit
MPSLTETIPERREAFRETILDPCEFSARWLHRRIWAKQREIAYSVARNPLTAVKGCHASGKTFVASGFPLWWMMRHKKSVAYTLAPTLRQVKTFWGEIALARTNGAANLRGALPEPTTTRLELAPNRYAQGASSSRGVNVQGIHGANVLLIGDEAPGIEADIWDAVEGMRAGGNVRVLIQGNPVVPSGYFYDAFTRGRNIWNCISISAFDTPNLQKPDGTPLTEEELLAMEPAELATEAFPALITRAWVRERLQMWGPKHPKYLARVLGEFPGDDPGSVFPLSWIERAKRDPTEDELKQARSGGTVQVGIDVAGAGADETVLTARVNGIILCQKFWPDADPRGPVSRELSEIKARRLGYPLASVVVDTVGIGYNFALHLADQGFPVYGCNAGARPIDSTQFANQKAEAHWTFRTWLQGNFVSQLLDEETAAQLSTIRYRENPRGLTEIESKDQRNKRGIPGSPDRAESLIMSYMRLVPQVETRTYNRRVQISPI